MQSGSECRCVMGVWPCRCGRVAGVHAAVAGSMCCVLGVRRDGAAFVLVCSCCNVSRIAMAGVNTLRRATLCHRDHDADRHHAAFAGWHARQGGEQGHPRCQASPHLAPAPHSQIPQPPALAPTACTPFLAAGLCCQCWGARIMLSGCVVYHCVCPFTRAGCRARVRGRHDSAMLPLLAPTSTCS